VTSTFPHPGELMSLLTALVWGISVILFKKSGETVHPVSLNLFKNLFATVLFSLTLLAISEPLKRDAPTTEYLLLLLSGAIGIGIADAVFFRSLNLLGAGLSSIVDCLYSPFIIILSTIWLGERLRVVQLVGVGLIMGAVLLVSYGRGERRISRHDLRWGVIWGVASMALMAVGIVMVKRLLERSPLLWVTELRLIGGTAVGLATLLFFPNRRRIVASLVKSADWRYVLPGSFAGAYVAMVLWLGGMKYALASTASALNQTSNVFVFIFAVLFLKEALNLPRILGITIAVTGVFLVTFG